MSEFKNESWIRRKLTEQPVLLLSLMYVFASVIGMFYSWAFLRPFGINMLQYAEISDFLLASVKEPLTWVLALVAVLIVQLDNFMSRRAQSRKPGWYLRWYGSDRYRQFNYPVSVMLVASFLFLYADLKVQRVRDGGGEVYQVQLADGSAPDSRVLLGTTVNFIFLFDPSTERVSIHPNENVLSLSKGVSAKPVEEPSVPDGSEEAPPDLKS